MGNVAMRWAISVSAAVLLIGVSAFGMGSAGAQPVPSPPPPAQPGSTTDELADMVMDVIEAAHDHRAEHHTCARTAAVSAQWKVRVTVCTSAAPATSLAA